MANHKPLSGQRISVIGLGKSGRGAAELAAYLGANVFISDPGNSPNLASNLKELKKIGITGELGQHSEKVYAQDLMILSPGVPNYATVVKTAQSKGVPVVGEIEFASRNINYPIAAVTGSNGKTTTVHILQNMCQSRSVHGALGGNVGVSFSSLVLQDLRHPDNKRIYVLEISSFQMEFIQTFAPDYALFLNLSPDHLDRYPSIDVYYRAKLDMVKYCNSRTTVIYNQDDPKLESFFGNSDFKLEPFSMAPSPELRFEIDQNMILSGEPRNPLVDVKDISLPGYHNLSNLLAAATCASCIGIREKHIAEVMRSFRSIPHRLEKIRTVDQVEYYNDSKATNVESVKVALASFSKPIILILGGKDKGGDFTQLIPFIHSVKAVIVYGKARNIIETALRDAVRPRMVLGLKDAVLLSHELASPGDIVLLSPGCASFDQFTDFEERGDRFRDWVNELEQAA